VRPWEKEHHLNLGGKKPILSADDAENIPIILEKRYVRPVDLAKRRIYGVIIGKNNFL
jgi:hypothetical protein